MKKFIALSTVFATVIALSACCFHGPRGGMGGPQGGQAPQGMQQSPQAR